MIIIIAAGAGYEKTSHYPNTTLDFLDIENIHVMRNALKALKECCFDTVNEDKNAWFAAVESTQVFILYFINLY